MKRVSQIGAVVAAGALGLAVLVSATTVTAADGTRPVYKGYQPRGTDPSGTDYHASSNSNDYHANYHADYSATQDGHPSQPQPAPARDPRDDARRFQDGDRTLGSPHGWGR